MPETKKPCPLCKEPGRRNADEVCWQCKREIERLRAVEANVKMFSGLEPYEVVNERSEHAWVNWAGDYLVGREMTRALARMVLALCPSDPSSAQRARCFDGANILPNLRYDYGHHTSPALMTKEAAAAVVKYRTLLEAELKAAYDTGRARGSDLLGQLARGELSTVDFEKKTKGKDE